MVAGSVRALPLAIVVLAACGGGGTDSKTPSLGGDYVLGTVDGVSVPTIVSSGLGVTETLVSGRFELVADSARDIKERRRTGIGQPAGTVTDTVWMRIERVNDRTLLLRPTYAPTLQPDTATFSEGVVANGTLTVRTRSAPAAFSAFRQTLVYTRQR